MSDIALHLTNITKFFESEITKTSTIFEKLQFSKNKSRIFEKNKVLDNISFEVKKGEVMGVIGRNGEGKSTLLRIISDIFRPDSGTVFKDGKIALFLDIGTGFQLEMTAKENIIMLGMMMGYSRSQILNKLIDILAFAELEKFIHMKLKHFSKGMYARLGFATAINMESDIFLIDEILAVGDKEFQQKSFQAFMKLRSEGKSFLIVSHDHITLKQICDRILLLHNGKVHSIGDPETVIAAYDNLI
jgi:ABC-type polysaccharide/polyol phosphate transport system ATPase subunit